MDTLNHSTTYAASKSSLALREEDWPTFNRIKL